MKRLILVILLIFVTLSNLYSVVYDDVGKGFKEDNYKRIVSLAPSITETLMFLGLSKKIVGVTRYCSIPNKKASIVGGLYDPDLEKIISLSPDIVFMLKFGSIENYNKLVKLGINVFVLDYSSLEDIEKNMIKISKLLNLSNTNKINEFRSNMESSVEKLSRKIKGKRVFVMYSYPLIYTASSNSYVSSLIRYAGGINTTDNLSHTYQTTTVDIELLLKLSPDIVIITDNSYKDIERELKRLGLKSKFIYVDPSFITPSPSLLKCIDTIYSSLE